MQGSVYLSQIREDLTFEVLNLYPDYDYPGKIKRLQVDISGAPEEDKELVLTVELQTLEGVLDGASQGRLRITSSIGTYEDLYLNPIDAEGVSVASSHILQGKMTFSKYAKVAFGSQTRSASRMRLAMNATPGWTTLDGSSFWITRWRMSKHPNTSRIPSR